MAWHARRSIAAVVLAMAVGFAGACGSAPRTVRAGEGNGRGLSGTDSSGPDDGGGDSTSGAGDDEGALREELDVDSWLGARTTEDGRVRVVFIGAAPWAEGDACTRRYDAEVVESAKEVRVTVVGRAPEMTTATLLCHDVGFHRQLDVGLAAPLGARRLVAGRTGDLVHVFDGSGLLEPAWLPDGWALLAEQPGDGLEAAPEHWARTYGPAPSTEAEPATDGRCVPRDATPVTISQGDVAAVARYPDLGERETSRHAMRGTEAVFRSGGSASSARLEWTEGGEGFRISTAETCAGDQVTPVETLLRIAESLG